MKMKDTLQLGKTEFPMRGNLPVKELDYQEEIELENTFAKILAKNAAVKKGVALKAEQMQTLVEELLRLPNPNYTPYGRPIFVQMNTSDIKKTLQ